MCSAHHRGTLPPFAASPTHPAPLYRSEKRTIYTHTAHGLKLRAGGFCVFTILPPDWSTWPVGAGYQQPHGGTLTHFKCFGGGDRPLRASSDLSASIILFSARGSDQRKECPRDALTRWHTDDARRQKPPELAIFSIKGSTAGLETSKEDIVASRFERNI